MQSRNRNDVIVPTIISDYVAKVSDKNIHPESRQFYYSTLLNIRSVVNDALNEYEKERHFKK